MSEGDEAITEEMLLAHADGRLGRAERAAVERFLAARPDRAAEVALWQRQNEALAALFGPAALEPVPPRLDPHVIAGRRRLSGQGRAWRAAAAVLLFAIGAGLGWFGRGLALPGETAGEVLVADALTAHAMYVQERRHAVEVAASDRDHLLSWLSNRIARPLDSPDLSGEGFELVGGRLLPPSAASGAGAAAQLMYENAGGERVTVYVTAAPPGTGETREFTRAGGLGAFYWANDAITCTVVGSLPEAEMEAVARTVYGALTRRPDSAYRL